MLDVCVSVITCRYGKTGGNDQANGITESLWKKVRSGEFNPAMDAKGEFDCLHL